MAKRYLLPTLILSLMLGSNAIAEENIHPIKLEKGTIEQSDVQGDVHDKEEKVDKKIDKKTDEGEAINFGFVDRGQVYSESNMVEDLKNSTTAVDVIYLDDLQKYPNQDVRRVFDSVPGLSATPRASIGYTGGMYLRGRQSFSVTADGLPLRNALNNNFGHNSPLDFMNTDHLERIEVLRGPQGTIIGNGAEAGAIALFTRRGRGPLTLEFDSEMGSFATFKETASIGAGNDSYDYYIGVTRLDTNGGHKIDGSNQSKRDDFRSTTVASNFGKRLLNGKAEIRNVFNITTSQKELPGSGSNFNANPLSRNEQRAIVENLTFSHAPSEFYDYMTGFGYHQYKYKNFSSVSRSMTDRLTFTTQHNIKPHEMYTFQVGYNLENENYQTLAPLNTALVQNNVYFNNIINVKDTLIVKAGTRILNHSGVGDYKGGTYGLPNVSAALRFPTPLVEDSYTKLRSSYGYAVTVPSGYQLFAPPDDYGWGPLQIGNPNLIPEKSNSWDIGIEQNFWNDKLVLSGGFFRTDYTNRIDWDWDISAYNNFPNSRANGFESSIEMNPCNWLSLEANHTYTKTVDENNVNLLFVPNNMFNFIASVYPNEKVSLYARTTTASDRVSSSTRLKGFVDVTLGADVKVGTVAGADLVLYGNLNNVLDQNYEIYKGYKHPGIHFTAGLNVKKPIGELL